MAGTHCCYGAYLQRRRFRGCRAKRLCAHKVASVPYGTGAGGALQVQKCLADGGQGRAVQDDSGDVGLDCDGNEEEEGGSGSDVTGV